MIDKTHICSCNSDELECDFEKKLALAREGLEKIAKIQVHHAWASRLADVVDIARATLAKLSETK
jgi:hypothetical protein